MWSTVSKLFGFGIEASATNLVIKGLDLEKWHNRILNIYGGSTLLMENTHIEHHFIYRNGGTAFNQNDALVLISNAIPRLIISVKIVSTIFMSKE